MDRRFPEKYIQSMINTFRLSRKWNSIDVQIPGMKIPSYEVSIMVPGLTREYGTFSIFRRNGLTVEYLVERETRESGLIEVSHEFVNFDQIEYRTDRQKFLVNADRAVYSLVDDFGFTQVTVWPNFYQVSLVLLANSVILY